MCVMVLWTRSIGVPLQAIWGILAVSRKAKDAGEKKKKEKKKKPFPTTQSHRPLPTRWNVRAEMISMTCNASCAKCWHKSLLNPRSLAVALCPASRMTEPDCC